MTAEEQRQPQEESVSLVEALPGIARIGAVAWWRATEFTVRTGVGVYTRLLKAAMSGQAPAELFREGGTDLRLWLRRILELVDESTPGAGRGHGAGSANGSTPNGHEPSLRERGAELLRRSADMRYDDAEHPAYERILEELAPDEARILRMLVKEGPQAAVDVRTGGPLALANSQLIAPGLTMIGREAGCLRPDRIHAYLNNLERLGLIWFSRETLEEQAPYQVLEAQPEVIEALEKAGRGRTVRRSIHLTDFGDDFCDMCLPLHTAEIDALPHPAESDRIDY
jgi:hypothetical protein